MASLPATIEAQWELFSKTRLVTLAQVGPLSQEQMDWQPAPHKWSAGEVVDHLLLSELFWRGQIAKLINLARAGRRPDLRITAADLNVALFFIPRPLLPFFSIPFEFVNMFMPRDLRNWLLSKGLVPMRNPDVNEPHRGKPAGELREQLLSHLSETRALFEANAGLDYHEMIHRHPSLGVNDVPGILNVLTAHEQRHQGQIREILREMSRATPMSPDKRCEIIYLHYKDSCETLSKLVEKRMRMFPLLFAVMGLILFQTFYPIVAAKLLTSWISHLAQAATERDSIEIVVPKLARSLLWFGLTVLVALISGCSVSIENRARYLRDLEEKICVELGGPLVRRESGQKPEYHRRTQTMYFCIFLSLVMIVSLAGLAVELHAAWDKPPLLAVTTERMLALADLAIVLVLAYCVYEFVKSLIGEVKASRVGTKQST